MKLTAGTVSALFNSQKNNPLFKTPILQLTALSKVAVAGDSKPRFKANVSDGQHYMKAVFASDISALLDKGIASVNHIVQVGAFSIRPKDQNIYMYIQSVLQYEACSAEIGTPTNIGGQSPQSNPENNGNKPSALKKSVPDMPPAKRQSIADDGFTPIKDINPFLNRWIIKGRVVSKTDIRKFNTKNGEGKLFSFEIADNSMQCKVVAFSEAVDIFYPIIENNKVFMLSHGTVKMANKQYTSNNFDYEIHLERNSEIQLIEDSDIPLFKFTFQQIGSLSTAQNVVDVIGIVKEVFPVSTVTAKNTGKEIVKRDLIIIDQTGNCRLTLWGAKAEEEFERDIVICLKSVRVGEYNGISLSTNALSQVITNVDIPEAIDLFTWYQKEGKDVVVERPKAAPRTQFMTDMKEGNQEYGYIQGTILYLKEDNLFYESCPSESCNKKVTLEDNGNYRCERCNYTYDACEYRYMLSFNAGDFTGLSWMTAFDDIGKKLFNMSAQSLKEMRDENPSEIQAIVKDIIGKDYTLRLKAKDDQYNGEAIKRITCLDCTPVDMAVQARRFLDAVEKISS